MPLLLNRLDQLLEEVAEFEVYFARDDRGELQLFNKGADLLLFLNDKILNPTQLLLATLGSTLRPWIAASGLGRRRRETGARYREGHGRAACVHAWPPRVEAAAAQLPLVCAR